MVDSTRTFSQESDFKVHQTRTKTLSLFPPVKVVVVHIHSDLVLRPVTVSLSQSPPKPKCLKAHPPPSKMVELPPIGVTTTQPETVS